VTSPNGGELWAPGSTQTVTWSSNMISGNGGKVGVYLVDTSTWGFATLSAGTPVSAGSWSWTVPAGQAVGNAYRIRLIYLGAATVSDYGNANFAIAPSPPTVTVTSNNAPETWSRGTIHNLTWTSYAVTGKVYVYLVNTATPSWETLDLAGGAINAALGSYSWSIPTGVAPGTKYLIRVFSKADINVSDYSDALLTVN
jgi:hypothetical protein